MPCEVALLSRNVKVRGADSERLTYGGHIMLMGSEQNGLQGRFSFAEWTQVGQSTIVGRYPIHFHKAGDLFNSYVEGVAVHRSYSRLVTLHGVRFVRVSDSVGFEIFGHNYFVEDGSESKNVLEGNIGINTRMIWSLSNKDVTAATYWVTHPDNIVRNNAAAGGQWYGFWYELMEHPEGPTTDVTICPDQSILGQFDNNTAHSYLKFGLRIKKHAPVQYPCKEIVDLAEEDKFAHNPSIQAVYRNFRAWKVNIGVQLEEAGDVVFENMYIADAFQAGFNIIRAELSPNCEVRDSLIVGISGTNNNQEHQASA